MDLCRQAGAVGCVLPRTLLSGGGGSLLRREFFTRWTIRSADVLWNQRRWVFPGINDRVQSVLLGARKQRPEAGGEVVRRYHDAKYAVFRRMHDDQMAYRALMAG